MKRFEYTQKISAAGFTLTELMAVVIILAILAGVAGGSYKKAIEQSHFSDGLTAASTIMGAVERYQADNYSTTQPKMSQLDISLANQKNCTSSSNYCKKTKYFETTIYNGYVDAKRMKGSTDGGYTVRVYSSTFGSNMLKGSTCVYRTGAGKNLCIGVGYSSCDTTNSECSKPE